MMRTISLIGAMLLACSLATEAQAEKFKTTITGKLSYGSDNLGLFGGGTLPANQAWTATYLYDDAAPGRTLVTGMNSTALSATSPNIISAIFSMAGQSYTFGQLGGQIYREAGEGYGVAKFDAYGGVAPMSHLELWFSSFGQAPLITGTDLGGSIGPAAPPTMLGQFYAAYYNGGFNVATSLNLRADTIEVERQASAAPEPGTWALMILGFGGAGVAMRRGRKKVTVAYA